MLGMFDNHVSTDLAADLLGHGSAWRGSLVGVLQDGSQSSASHLPMAIAIHSIVHIVICLRRCCGK